MKRVALLVIAACFFVLGDAQAWKPRPGSGATNYPEDFIETPNSGLPGGRVASDILSEAESNVVMKSCFNFAKFLCLDLTHTNQVKMSTLQKKAVGSTNLFQVAMVRFTDYEFWIQKDGTIRRFFMYRPNENEKHESSCDTPPTAQRIRDLLCPKVRFEGLDYHHMYFSDSATYTWCKEGSRFIVEGQEGAWEWVNVEVEKKTHRCLRVQNTVLSAR